MPYTKIFKSGDKYCFKNEETGQKICSDTEHGAIATMRARYAVEHGEKLTGKPGKEFKVRHGK
jgi:hypothetical protein